VTSYFYHRLKQSRIGPILSHWFSKGSTRWLATLLVVATSAALIARTIWLMDRGFDFTDEAFYLMTIQQPSNYKWNYGLFGYALKPLYELAGESVAGLRRICAVLLVIVGATAGVVVLRRGKFDWRAPEGIQVVAVCAALSLCYYAEWLTTPSYNLLSFIGGLALFIALLLLSQTDSMRYSAVWAAIAGILATFGRPHGAVGYGVLYLTAVLFVVPTVESRLVQIVTAAIATIFIALVVVLFLPLSDIFSQIKVYNAIFGTSHPLHFSFIDQQWEFIVQSRGWLLAAVLFVATIVMRSGNRSIVNGMRPFFVAAAIVIILAAIFSQVFRPNTYRIGIQTAAIAFSVLTLGWLKKPVDFRLIKLLSLATLIPWAATLGSSAPIQQELVLYFGLWLIVAFAAFVLVVQNSVAFLAATSTVALCLCICALNFGFSSPYRLPGTLAAQVVPTEIGWGSVLKLDTRTAEFISAMRTATKQNGFCAGATAIDVSGDRPGMVFIIDGKMPIFPWLFGGYSISNYFGEEYFKRLGPEGLKQSWLIAGSPGQFSMEQLRAFGVDFSKYRSVAEVRSPLDNWLGTIYAPIDQVSCPAP
jgi:hypothetical protein